MNLFDWFRSRKNKNEPLASLDLNEVIRRFQSYKSRKPESVYDSRKNLLSPKELKWLMVEMRKKLAQEATLVEIKPPIKIVGDIHGQFLDLLRLFEHCGWPPKCRFLFLGDYVDRGPQGVECFALLSALKVKYPDDVYILRGNHESSIINLVYGLYDEMKMKYKNDRELWESIHDTFDYLPIAALISRKIFCVHGGLSPDLYNFDQIRTILRPREVPDFGLMCDLLWSDPEADIKGWSENTRGISFTFGRRVVRKFCKDLKIAMIVRGHQVPKANQKRGYTFFAGTRMLTLFSAPHYCRNGLNDGAVLEIDEEFNCKFELLRPDPHISLTYEKL